MLDVASKRSRRTMLTRTKATPHWTPDGNHGMAPSFMDHLAWAIRLAGGSDEAVAGALLHPRAVGHQLRPPRPAVPHALHATSSPLDAFTLIACDGNTKLFLNVVDSASWFGLTLELESRTPLQSGRPVPSAGAPGAASQTPSSSTEEARPRPLSARGAEGGPITMKTMAAETTRQHLVGERRAGAWKGVAKSVIDQYSTSFRDAARTMHLRVRDNHSHREAIDLLPAARRATAESRYHRCLFRAFLARMRLHDTI